MIVRYKVEYWDEDSDMIDVESGLTWGETLGDGVNRIAHHYGEENVVNISVYECDDVIYDSDLNDFSIDQFNT